MFEIIFKSQNSLCAMQVPQHVFELFYEKGSDILIGSWRQCRSCSWAAKGSKTRITAYPLSLFRGLCYHLTRHRAVGNYG